MELDDSRITREARRFGSALFTKLPALRQYASVVPLDDQEGRTLVIQVPAPDAHPDGELVIWVDGGEEPSVSFGSWHTHEIVWAAEHEDAVARTTFIDLIAGILEDRFVVCEDAHVDGCPAIILDLSEPDCILDELTREGSSGRVRLRSWSGALDREIGVEELAQDGRA